MKCWNCGTILEDPPLWKLSFRAECDKCYSALHCCCNCRNYRPGLPNNCAIPGIEYVADRQAMNFCDEFELLGLPPSKKTDPKDIEKRLFGE